MSPREMELTRALTGCGESRSEWTGWRRTGLASAILAATLSQLTAPQALACTPAGRNGAEPTGSAQSAPTAPGPARPVPAPPIIVVTGHGLDLPPATPAYDSQTIGHQALATTASGGIEGVLATIAGFQEFRRSDSRSANPSAQGATLRALGGNAASRTLVLLDGVPMADPMFGSVPFSAIAPERLESIRVTHGGGMGAFGAGAVAGSIEMESAGANALGLFSGEALGDDRGETSLSATLAPHLGQGFAVISARRDRGNGFWTTPANQRVPASVRAAYDSWSLGLRGVAPLAPDIELQVRGLIFDDARTLRFAGADSTSRGEDASLRLVGRGPWRVDLLGYVQARDFSNVVISSSSFLPTLNQRSTPSTGLGGKLELRPPVGADHLLRLGADWRLASGDLVEDSYQGHALKQHRRAGGHNGDTGLFAEDDWTLGRLVLTAGARADRWSIRDGYLVQATPAGVITTNTAYPDRAGWAASGRAGVVWKAGDGLSLRSSAYTGMRQPTLNELYRSFVVFPVTTQANANLVNERLKGYEAGVDFAPTPSVYLSATAFYNRVEHAVANVSVGANLRQRQNVDAIRARGVELRGGLKLGKVSLDGSLALSDAVVEAPGTSINGLRPAQTPKIAASATLGWHPRAGWLVSTTLRHVGAQYEDDLATSNLPAATTLDGFAQMPLGGPFTLVLRGENLANATVETRNQAGSIDLGTPRTVWAGVLVRLP